MCLWIYTRQNLRNRQACLTWTLLSWNDCTKLAETAVMYMCDRVSSLPFFLRFFYWLLKLFRQCDVFCFWFYFYDVLTEFRNCSDGVVFFVFHFMLMEHKVIFVYCFMPFSLISSCDEEVPSNVIKWLFHLKE